MGENKPDVQRVLDNGTNFVVWTEISGIATGDYFYMDYGLPTYAAALGSGTLPTVTVSGVGTKISLTGSGLSTSTTYNIISFHGRGIPRRFA